MRKYTRKELKNMVALGMAEDVTRANNEDYEKIIKREDYLSQVGYSSGVYGCDGMLLKGYKNRNILCRDFQNVSNLYFWLRGENFDN